VPSPGREPPVNAGLPTFRVPVQVPGARPSGRRLLDRLLARPSAAALVGLLAVALVFGVRAC
jgi:simple sugar transport system permease protein